MTSNRFVDTTGVDALQSLGCWGWRGITRCQDLSPKSVVGVPRPLGGEGFGPFSQVLLMLPAKAGLFLDAFPRLGPEAGERIEVCIRLRGCGILANGGVMGGFSFCSHPWLSLGPGVR